MSKEKQYCTFTVDDLFFGVDVLLVQEVIRYQDITRVPLAPSAVRGLINLRGQIVTAIDLRKHLGLNSYGAKDTPTNIVVRNDEETVSLLVDEIEDVLEVDDETFEPPPDTVRGIARDVISGVHKLESRLLLVLDTKRTINLLGNESTPSKATAA